MAIHEKLISSSRTDEPLGAPHVVPTGELARLLGADLEHGIRSNSVGERRERYGPNVLTEAPPVPAWRRFAGQFTEIVIGILIAAALISGVMGEWADALAILAIVLLNGILGFLQEEKAGRSLAALKKLSSPMAKAVRDGELRAVPASELVVGDRIELEAGDSVPADARLVQSFVLRVQESALPGESVPVEKDSSVSVPESVPLGDRRNMLYMGTVVAAGKASAVVVATGMTTELGRIAGMLQRSEPERTPLQRRLAELGKILVVICLVAVAVIFALQAARGEPLLEAFLLAVSLAVAAVPEGMPAVVTMALALGLQRMVKRNALVRKLPSVETLGSVTVICSDKTGTLTKNEMTVREVAVASGRFEVTGAGYTPRGEFLRSDGAPGGDDQDLRRALSAGSWCNNARVYPRSDGAEGWQVVGDPTEGALVVVAMKAGIDHSERAGERLFEIPFDSERKAMSVVVKGASSLGTMYTKGAPEVVLAKCAAEWRGGEAVPLSGARRAEILASNAAMASRALRVLGLAERPDVPLGLNAYEESGLIFSGLIGMIDPPREEVKDAVQRCRDAGIRPVMITGDHPDTALAIARELGIASETEGVLSGRELDALGDDELVKIVDRTPVYARVSAEHKLKVVRAWQARGQVVAMTGDGVNDAPAVRAADIGIAMGVTGTDVTKEASDMVLTDDNFTSIVNAVEEGRGIFDNIQKFVHYLLACNTSEVLFMLFAVVVGWPAPLTAIQILWINLVTDGLPALALGMEPPEKDIMSRPPRPPKEPVITSRAGFRMVGHGLLMAGAAATAFALAYRGNGLEHARTVALCTIAYAQLFFAFACRSFKRTLPELGPFSNPYLFGAIAVSGLLQLAIVALPFTRPVFDVTGHPASEWVLVFLLALAPVTVVEVGKLIRAGVTARRRMRDGAIHGSVPAEGF